ncbi:4Fe-4S double cluster binding domain-containing protein [Bacteroidota bacterium]
MQQSDTSTYTQSIKQFILEQGASLIGFTNIKSLDGLKTYPDNLLDNFNSAISIAVNIPNAIFDTIIDKPTPIYASFYGVANDMLDKISLQTAIKLQSDGYPALPIPASKYATDDNLHGSLPHRAVALTAGLGWIGKSSLLITSDFGPRVRLATILTTAHFIPDTELENLCGTCEECISACPADAIKGVGTTGYYETPNEALYFDKCIGKLRNEFTKLPNIKRSICGICIAACPYGR